MDFQKIILYLGIYIINHVYFQSRNILNLIAMKFNIIAIKRNNISQFGLLFSDKNPSNLNDSSNGARMDKTMSDPQLIAIVSGVMRLFANLENSFLLF